MTASSRPYCCTLSSAWAVYNRAREALKERCLRQQGGNKQWRRLSGRRRGAAAKALLLYVAEICESHILCCMKVAKRRLTCMICRKEIGCVPRASMLEKAFMCMFPTGGRLACVRVCIAWLYEVAS